MQEVCDAAMVELDEHLLQIPLFHLLQLFNFELLCRNLPVNVTEEVSDSSLLLW